ncbi:hypothetical protein HanPI659440_Chr17g0698601 [Helianthus annuus]|nr:hypothetical protein HanPI659440_Chr17g0698601 [Helianthus annuus]
MSDKWLERSTDVSVLLLNGEEDALYQSAFKTFDRTLGVRPLRAREEYWYEQIKRNFIYASAELFVNPPVSTEGARIPNPRPCHAVTSVGKEIVYLSNEESLGSSDHDLRPWDDVFAGVLRDLRIDPEEKKIKKAPTKKKVTVAGGATGKKGGATHATLELISKKGTLCFRQSNLEDYVIASNSLKGLRDVGEKPQSSAIAVARSSGSAGPRGLDSGTTPSSIHEEEETEAEVEAEKLIRKRPRTETSAPTPYEEDCAKRAYRKKKGSLRSLYRFSPGKCWHFFLISFCLSNFQSSFTFPKAAVKKPEVEVRGPEAKKTKFTIIPPKTGNVEGLAGETEKPADKVVEKVGEKVVEKTIEIISEKVQGSELVKTTGLDQHVITRKEPQIRTENLAAQHDALAQTENVQTATGGSAGDVQAQVILKDVSATGRDVGGSGVTTKKGDTGKKPRQPSLIRAEDTLGDIYSKTYTEDHANEAHVPV